MNAMHGYHVDLEELVTGLGRHLRTSWRQGVPLVLTIRGRPQMIVETLEDLEIVQEAVYGDTPRRTHTARHRAGIRPRDPAAA